jgi:hypothetical protein
VGTVAHGADIDTNTVGAKSFTVNATDNAGNTATVTHNYTVQYKICLLYDPLKAAKSGSTIPIRLLLCDNDGNNESSSSLVVTARGFTKTSSTPPPWTADEAEDSGNANPDYNFRFTSFSPGVDGYIFNLSTRGLDTGTWWLWFTVGNDPTLYAAPFGIR